MIALWKRRADAVPSGVVGAIVVALIGLDIAVGIGRLPIIAMVTSRVLLAVLAGGFVLGLTLIRVELGLLMLPVLAVVVPTSLGTGTASPVVVCLLFALYLIAVWGIRMLLARDLSVLRSPVNLPLLGFTISAVLATVNSNADRDSLVLVPERWSLIQAGGLSVILASAGTMLVAANALTDLRWTRWLTWTLLGLGTIAIAGYFVRWGQDLPGFAIGGLFSLWVIVLALGQAVFNDGLSTKTRVALVVLAGAWLCRRFLLELYWLSGWVPAVAAILAMALMKSKKVFVPTVLVALALGGMRYDEILDTQVLGGESGNNFLRLDLWQQNLEVSKNHYLLGTGVAGYAVYYMTFIPSHAMSTHSNYLDIFAQTGLVGSFFFLWLLVALFRTGIRARRRCRSGFLSGFANAGLSGLVGIVVAMAFGDWFIPFVYNQTIAGFRYTVHSWMLLGVLVMLAARRIEEDP